VPYFPRFRALALRGRRPTKRAAGLVNAGVRETCTVADLVAPNRVARPPVTARTIPLRRLSPNQIGSKNRQSSVSPPPKRNDGNMVQSRKHLILIVHGIRTYGPWQDRLETLIRAEASQQNSIQLDIRHYKFGFFTIFSFLVPWFRDIAVKQFRNHLSSILDEGRFDRIDIVAHSFGTFLSIKGLSGLDRQRNVHFQTVILCGSVLSPNDDLSRLIGPGRLVGRIVNDCGTKDAVLLLTLGIVGVGMGGRLGLQGFQSQSFINRYFEFGHGGYFSNEFMGDWWLPLLLDDEPVRSDPPRPEVPPLSDRFWRTPR
jgi:hypothetical protein